MQKYVKTKIELRNKDKLLLHAPLHHFFLFSYFIRWKKLIWATFNKKIYMLKVSQLIQVI